MVSHSVYTILPIEKIGYIKDVDFDLYDVLEPIGDKEYDYEHIEYCKRSLVLSTDGDATTLLCDPGENFRVSQWSSWIPGIEWDDLNFYEWMNSELEELKSAK